MKSQKIQKSALFDSVDENGVLAKCVEHGWSFRSYSKHWGEKGAYDIPHNYVLTVCKSNVAFVKQKAFLSIEIEQNFFFFFKKRANVELVCEIGIGCSIFPNSDQIQ